jgi:hypothetical protein
MRGITSIPPLPAVQLIQISMVLGSRISWKVLNIVFLATSKINVSWLGELQTIYIQGALCGARLVHQLGSHFDEQSEFFQMLMLSSFSF